MTQLLTTDERFDKVDTQLAEMNKQLDRIVTAVVQGFERVDEKLEDKADKSDMQRVYDYLDKIISSKKLTTMSVSSWGISSIGWVHEVADKIGYTLAA